MESYKGYPIRKSFWHDDETGKVVQEYKIYSSSLKGWPLAVRGTLRECKEWINDRLKLFAE